MLSNLKTSTKVVAGFGVLLTILAVLGIVGYVMFSRVDSNVTGLTDHSLAAVKNSTGVERAAFETILEEKNYVLYKKDEIHQKAKEKLADLAGRLDQVDKIAEQFNDTDLAKKSKEVRGLAAQFGKLYDEGVAALKNNKTGEETMDLKGNLVGNEAIAYMAAKKAEYLESKDALAIVTRIESRVWEMRMATRISNVPKTKALPIGSPRAWQPSSSIATNSTSSIPMPRSSGRLRMRERLPQDTSKQPEPTGTCKRGTRSMPTLQNLTRRMHEYGVAAAQAAARLS